ncbi:MAG: guanylate kinase [Alphaproteobacteria bacterium]|nr:guanylate kinase [Alphaproteobacteria bacterium]
MAGYSLTRRGLMLVLSSPSGAGKTTVARALLETESDLKMSVSATTRAPRPGEKDGADYFFVTSDAFNGMVARGEFLEHARVFGNLYGTPRAAVERQLAAGRDVLFDIDWQGTQQLRETAPEDLVTIFILPPSLTELERRLRSRAQDSDDTVRHRMDRANSEMSHWAEYDYVFVNRDLAASIANVRTIMVAERLKRSRQVGMSEFVNAMRLDG